MSVESGVTKPQMTQKEWNKALSKYAQPNLRKAIWQILNTFIPYLALWAIMIRLIHLGYPYWIILLLTIPASALMVRIFIFFHDCCHGSFFASRRANKILGYISGILTLTPYEDWRLAHNRHHATAADLDRRGTGDVWTLTVDEYLTAPPLKRIAYRLFRDPLILLGLGPTFVFLISQRFPHKGARKAELYSVLITDLGFFAILITAWLTFGLRTYILIQLPILIIGGAAGVWLFYVQHQYEGVYWARHEEWELTRASLEGSSYYKLPKLLQWVTGNIGLHHIHHLQPRIPNYTLQQAQDDIPALQTVKPLTLGRSLKSLGLNLWDEAEQKLVSFRSVRARLSQAGG